MIRPFLKVPASIRLGALCCAVTLAAGCATNPTLGRGSLGDVERESRRGSAAATSENIRREGSQAGQAYQRAAELSLSETQRRQSLERLADLALNERFGDEESTLDDDGISASSLYRTLLDGADDKEREQLLYNLARAYDIEGNLEASIETLTELVDRYPSGRYYTESQFRRAEMLFSDYRYEEAARAYAATLASDRDHPYRSQALYKQGWSYYALAEYERALDIFFILSDELGEAGAGADPESIQYKLLSDTLRAQSLAFANMEGIASLQEWDARRGSEAQRPARYRSLAELYLTQERFRDAAETYKAFTGNAPNDQQGPAFMRLHIDAYARGGFPSLVLEAKQDYVAAFGPESSYWERFPQRRADYAAEMANEIHDLASHFHAMAQQTGELDQYDLALHYYALFDDAALLTGDQERRARVHHRRGEILLSLGRYADAIAPLELAAYHFPGYEKAEGAAYQVLVAQQERARAFADDDPDLAVVRDMQLASSLRFVSRFPESPRADAVAQTAIELQLGGADLGAARQNAAALLERTENPAFRVYALETIANADFDAGEYAAAEEGYGKLLDESLAGHVDASQRSTFIQRRAAAIYRQGEMIADTDPVDAAGLFLRAAAAFPGSELAATARFDAATLYAENDRHQEAITLLEALREESVAHPLADTIPDRLALSYEAVGNITAAAGELALIADQYQESDPELAAQALWRSARLYDQQGDYHTAISLYARYVERYPMPLLQRAEGEFRLVELHSDLGQESEREQWLKALVTTSNLPGAMDNDRIAWLGAHARFALAERQFQAFADAPIRQPIRRSLEQKNILMRDAIRQYEDIASIGIAEYVSAARFKLGELYRILARDIIESERPGSMDELELEMYEMMLEEQALPYEDQAIDIHIANADLVEQNIYNAWVRSSFDALSDLLPGRYAKHEQIESRIDIPY